MKENQNEMEFNRLCDDVDGERFDEIKSHAKKHIATANPSNCRVCRLLERCEDSEWSSRRDVLVSKLSELETAESQRKFLQDELEKLKTEAASSDSITKMDDELWIEILNVMATREELQRDRARFEREEYTMAYQEVVDAALSVVRTRPFSTFYGTRTRKFFLGHFVEDEQNFSNFKEGKFDENLIANYDPPGTPEPDEIPTGLGVDLSPRDGVIGDTSIYELLDGWRQNPNRIVWHES